MLIKHKKDYILRFLCRVEVLHIDDNIVFMKHFITYIFYFIIITKPVQLCLYLGLQYSSIYYFITI